jgi:hypothetical protein
MIQLNFNELDKKKNEKDMKVDDGNVATINENY